MTDRVHSLTVVLEKDMRIDDCRALVDAILMMRNVLTVQENISDITDHMAEERARHELGKKIWNVIHPFSSVKK